MTEALAVFSGFLVLTTATPGAATALVLFPLWTTMTPIDPRVVAWDEALDEVTVADPVMATPVARPVVLTSTSRVSEAPAGRFPMEQVILPEPADEQLVPEAAMPARSIGEGRAAVGHAHTGADRPVTVAVEVLAMVAPQPAVGPGGDLVLEGWGGGRHLEGGGGRRRVHRGRVEGRRPRAAGCR